MTIYVGSLKFSPVFKSHCCAFGKACEKEGHDVRYLFSQEYEWMLPAEVKEKTVFVGDSVGIGSMIVDGLNVKNKQKLAAIFKDRPQAIYLHNYHFLNNYVAKLSKKNGCRFIYHVHEPYVANKKAHGGFHQYWLYIFEHWQGKLLQNTDVAVVSSEFASFLFEKRYLDFSGKKLLVPLMFEDLGDSEIEPDDRKFVTFVGPPVPAKNPEKFLDIVDRARQKHLNLNFLLISKSQIKDSKYFGKDNLQIFFEEQTSDEDFGRWIKKSFSVLAPYKRETQSSVILVSYMYGTPVITSDVGGLPEFVCDDETGFSLSLDAGTDEWLERICCAQQNFLYMSKNCRKYFVDNFSGENWKNFLDDLLGD